MLKVCCVSNIVVSGVIIGSLLPLNGGLADAQCTLVTKKFSYVTHEKNSDPKTVTRAEINDTLHEYRLDIPVFNGTNCRIEVVFSDGRNSYEKNVTLADFERGDKCKKYFVEHKEFPWCFDEWFVTKIHDELYDLRYMTLNISLLPREGRYDLRLNDGK